MIPPKFASINASPSSPCWPIIFVCAERASVAQVAYLDVAPPIPRERRSAAMKVAVRREPALAVLTRVGEESGQ